MKKTSGQQDAINATKRERYANDPVYREKILAGVKRNAGCS